jgi:hypothetical protein
MGAPATSNGNGPSSPRKAGAKPLISTEKSSPFLKNATGITAGIHNLKQRLEFLETGNEGLFYLCIEISKCQRLWPARVLYSRVNLVLCESPEINLCAISYARVYLSSVAPRTLSPSVRLIPAQRASLP